MIRFDGAGKDAPILLDSRTTFIATSYMVGAVYNNEQAAATTGAPVGPALIIDLQGLLAGRENERLTVMLPLPERPTHHGLPGGREAGAALREALYEGLTAIMDSYDDPQMFAGAAAAAHEANLRAGFYAGTEAPRCPGCQSRLFGEVALRGACLACFPETPAGDAAALPALRWPDDEADR